MAEVRQNSGDVSAAVTSSTLSNTPRSPPREFSWTRWAIITVLLVSLASYFMRRQPDALAAAVTPTKLLDSRIGFTPLTARETLHSLGPDGRKIYKEINVVDFLLTPIVLNAWLLDTLPPQSPPKAALRWMLAFVYMFGDILENVCVAVMLRIYPRFIDAIAWLCCIGNLLKWAGFVAALGSIVYEGAIRVGNMQRKRKAKAT